MVNLENEIGQINNNWCIGCGVFVSKCSNDAIKIVLREDLKNKIPEKDFQILHEIILKSRN